MAIGLAAPVDGGIIANENPAGLQGINVIWAVPTNVWPADRIWSYKVVPQEFSDAVISNVMAIGPFTIADRKKLPAEALLLDKKAICFHSKDDSRWLEILPTLGYIKYYDQNAEAITVSAIKDVPEPIVGVPNESEATQLGLKYLRLLGIDNSEIARKAGTFELDAHWAKRSRQWTDQKTGKNIDEILDYGVFFTRQIDGMETSGFGDVFVEFGNNAKLHALEVSWRNLRPYQLFDQFVPPEQVVKSIKSGQIALPLVDGWPIAEIKTLTIHSS